MKGAFSNYVKVTCGVLQSSSLGAAAIYDFLFFFYDLLEGLESYLSMLAMMLRL